MSSQSPSPIQAPQHILTLLSTLHKKSLDQESAMSLSGKVRPSHILRALEARDAASQPPTTTTTTTTDPTPGDVEDQHGGPQLSSSASARQDFDALMLDKFIALDQDKCHFMYQLITAMGATNVVEAGTSFGVSTIYLALAVGGVSKRTGRAGMIVATEKEAQKAERARGYWRECGGEVESVIDLRVGDILETLKKDLPGEVDLLLLDIWSPLSLPVLKIVQPHFRPGSVVLVDNTISSAEGYKDLLAYMRAPGSGFQNTTLPFTNGFEMSVYVSERSGV